MGLEGDYWGISGGYADGLGKFCLLTLLRQEPLKDAAAEVTRLWNGQSVCGADLPGKCHLEELHAVGRSADIPVRSNLIRANRQQTRARLASGNGCGQECPRSAGFEAATADRLPHFSIYLLTSRPDFANRSGVMSEVSDTGREVK